MSRGRVWCAMALCFVAPCFVATTASPLVAQDDKSPPAALTLFSDAANFQNNGAYDLALEEWKKFVSKYPKDKLAPKARHYQGVCELQLKKYVEAAASFEQVVKSSPKFELIEDAYLNWAWSQYSAAQTGKKELFVKAAATFGELLAKHPKTKYGDQALYFRAESLYMAGQVKESIAPYRQLVKDHADSKLICDALYALGVSLEELKDYAEAGKVYDQFLNQCKQDPLTNEVRMRKAETLAQTDQLEAAVRLFQQVADANGFESADHAAYRRAACLAQLNEFSAAADGYAQLIAKFPETNYKDSASIGAARCYYRADNAAAASKWLQTVWDKKGPDAPEAAHWLCLLKIRAGEFGDAGKLAEQAVAAAKDSEYLVQLKIDQGNALYEQGDDARRQALGLFLKVAADHADHPLAPQSHYNAAFAAMELADYDQALKLSAEFQTKFANHNLTPDAKYIQAESNLQSNRGAEAEKILRELVALTDHSESAVWVVRLGSALYAQKKYADTDTYLTSQAARLQTPPQQAEAQFLIGASRFYGEKYDTAVSALDASLKAKADWTKADETMLFLARSQFKLKQHAAAKQTVAQLLQKFPNSAIADQVHYRLGEIHYDAEDWAEAAKAYAAVAKWPDSLFAPYSLYGAGWSNLRLEQYPVAVTAFTTLLAEHGEHELAPEGQFARGMCQRQLGKFKEAIADIDAFLKTNPQGAVLADAQYEKGVSQVGTKDFAGATTTLAGLAKSQPEYAHLDKVLYELAWALKSQDKHAEAVAHFAALVSKRGDSPFAAESHFHVGEQLYDAEKYAEAAAAYQEAKKKAPATDLKEKVIYKLGFVHFKQDAYKQALSEFNEQLQQFPNGGLANAGLFMKGECSFKLEDYKAAFDSFSTAAKTAAQDPNIGVLTLLHGGQAAAQLKDWKASLDLLDQAVKKYPQAGSFAEAVYERGYAHQQLKDAAKAKADFELAADKSRNEVGARARFMLGEVYFGEKSYATAIRQFQRVMFGYGATKATPEVKVWQAKAGFEAARCAEVQIQDAATAAARAQFIKDAQKFYTYVVQNHPTDMLAETAKKRLADLAKL